MTPRQVWKTLGIARTSDRTDIRRAYARLLKVTNPEDDPDGFQNLRAAYEAALEAAEAAERGETSPPLGSAFSPADAWQASRRETSNDSWQHLHGLQLSGANGKADDAPSGPAPRSPLAQAYEDACDRLEAMFDPLSIATDDDRLEALIVILTAPYSERQASTETTEAWLIRLLLDNQPRSDMLLLTPVATHFGWATQVIVDNPGDSLQARKREIVQRVRHNSFLRSLRKPDNDYHYAYAILSRPYRKESLWNSAFDSKARRNIAQCLERVRRIQPSVEAEFNTETVAIWEARLERPGLAGISSVMAALSVPCTIILVLAAFFPPQVFAAAFCLCFLPPLWTSIWLLHSRCIARPRLKWAKDRHQARKPWLAFGWGPALIALLLLAAAPASAGLNALVLSLAVPIAAWAMITGEPDREPGDWPWRLRLVFDEIFLVSWWLISMRDMGWGTITQMSMAIAASIVVAGYGRLPLARVWAKLDPRSQRGMLDLLCGGGIAATAGLIIACYEPALMPLAFAGGATILLMYEVPVLNSQPWQPLWRRLTMTAAVFLQFVEPLKPLVPMIGGGILLVWAVVNGIRARGDVGKKREDAGDSA